MEPYDPPLLQGGLVIGTNVVVVSAGSPDPWFGHAPPLVAIEIGGRNHTNSEYARLADLAPYRGLVSWFAVLAVGLILVSLGIFLVRHRRPLIPAVAFGSAAVFEVAVLSLSISAISDDPGFDSVYGGVAFFSILTWLVAAVASLLVWMVRRRRGAPFPVGAGAGAAVLVQLAGATAAGSLLWPS